jgi:hypothetical protein
METIVLSIIIIESLPYNRKLNIIKLINFFLTIKIFLLLIMIDLIKKYYYY